MPILGEKSFYVQDLHEKYGFPIRFQHNFQIEWLSPLSYSREEILTWFFQEYKKILDGQQQSLVKKEELKHPPLYQISNWNEEQWGMWEDIYTPVLRNFVSIEYHEEESKRIFTSFELFYLRALRTIQKEVEKEKMSSKNALEDFQTYLMKRRPHLSKDIISHFLQLQVIWSYFKLSYFGFLKERYIEILLRTHPACLNRTADIYRADEQGDLYEKVDFFVYRSRPHSHQSISGIWRSLGVGSKSIKNETLLKCHDMIRNYKDKEDESGSCFKAGGGLWLMKPDKFDAMLPHLNL